VYCI
jgi:hypothetical protein